MGFCPFLLQPLNSLKNTDDTSVFSEASFQAIFWWKLFTVFVRSNPVVFNSHCPTATSSYTKASRNSNSQGWSQLLNICRVIAFPPFFQQLAQNLTNLAREPSRLLVQIFLCPAVTWVFCCTLFLLQLCDPGLSVDVT